MQFGVTIHPLGAFPGIDDIAQYVQKAEGLGNASYLPDHAAVPVAQADRTGSVWWDPLILRLITTRSHLARALTALDRVSGGRIDVGIGVGRPQEKFDALGVPIP